MLFNHSKQCLCDERPSKALTEMRSLCCLPPNAAGNSKKIDIFLALWLRHLSDPVRSAITNFSDFNDTDLTTHADSLLDAHNATSHLPIHTTTAPDPPDEDNLLSNRPNNAITAASPSHRPPQYNKVPTLSRT